VHDDVDVFDTIEDLVGEYMREPQRHYYHCRFLRCVIQQNPFRYETYVCYILDKMKGNKS
jgi:hypothetical protein